MIAPFEYVVDVTEHGVLVVRHTFYGVSQEKAMSLYRAHLKNDRFLAECVEQRCFEGHIACRASAFWRVFDGILVVAS